MNDVNLSRPNGARAKIVLAVDSTPEAAAASRLADRLADALHADIVRVDVTVDDHDLVSVLAARTNDSGASLCVVGMRRTSSHLLSAPTGVHHLADELNCPLIAVAEQADGPFTGNVVIGIDGSSASKVALDLGAELAAAMGGTASAVYAIDDMYNTFSSHGWFGKEEVEARREAAEEARPIEFVETLGGSTESILDRVAIERDATLIVLATKERWSLTGGALGKVPTRMLHELPFPILLVPHQYATAHEGATAETS